MNYSTPPYTQAPFTATATATATRLRRNLQYRKNRQEPAIPQKPGDLVKSVTSRFKVLNITYNACYKHQFIIPNDKHGWGYSLQIVLILMSIRYLNPWTRCSQSGRRITPGTQQQWSPTRTTTSPSYQRTPETRKTFTSDTLLDFNKIPSTDPAVDKNTYRRLGVPHLSREPRNRSRIMSINAAVLTQG